MDYFMQFNFCWQEWEMLLLTTLKWDVSVVVSTDFIDHLLARLHLESDSKSAPFVHLMEEVKRSAIGLCLLCSKGKSCYPFWTLLSSSHDDLLDWHRNWIEFLCSARSESFSCLTILLKISTGKGNGLNLVTIQSVDAQQTTVVHPRQGSWP